MRKFIARFRQAPVFSTVYLLGAALSVASVMLVAIFIHVKTAAIYPEYSRSELLYFKKLRIGNDGEDKYFPREITDLGFGRVTALTLSEAFDSLGVGSIYRLSDCNTVYNGYERFDDVVIKCFDQNVFSIYNLDFIEGKPFTKADVCDGNPVIVISDRLARRIFGSDSGVVGKTLSLGSGLGAYGFYQDDGETAYKIVGVYREGSRLLTESFAEIIMPVEREVYVPSINIGREILGRYAYVFIPQVKQSGEEFAAVANEALRQEKQRLGTVGFIVVRTMSTELSHVVTSSYGANVTDGYTLDVGQWPRGSLQLQLGNVDDIEEKFDASGFFKLYGVLILVLLLVPALNLSSLIAGNMDAKMNEMGIRKAFGARRSTLLRQIVDENLWLTGAGSILGVLLAWLGVALWRNWLFAGVGADGDALSTAEVMLDPAMLFAPQVFLAAVVICLTLNLASSLIPAWWALRRPAIDAIRMKS